MEKFSALTYSSPDYNKVKSELASRREKLVSAQSYTELRSVFLAGKMTDEYLDMMEELAYIRHLLNVPNAYYNKEVCLADEAAPHITELRKACDDVLQDSFFEAEIRAEFGEKFIRDLKCKKDYTLESIALQIRENELREVYNHLVSLGKPKTEISDELDDLFDKLAQTRTELAKSLGFTDYVEMVYCTPGRRDYGRDELTAFRLQVQGFLTPFCAELKKHEKIGFPTPIGSVGNILDRIRVMFHEISQESGDYIDFIFDHEMFDLEPKPGKHPMVACCMLPHYKVPFILQSFEGQGVNVSELIHELGHGFAFYTAARKQKLYAYHRSTTAINETHSNTMELFSYPYAEYFFGAQNGCFIRAHLNDKLLRMPRRCAIDEFEHTVYENPAMTKPDRCALWREIELKYMPWLNNEHNNGRGWHTQMHPFTHPFTFVDYNLAQLSAFEFFGRSKTDFRQAWKDYIDFCSLGGSEDYRKLLSIGGLSDPFSDGIVKKLCTLVTEGIIF